MTPNTHFPYTSASPTPPFHEHAKTKKAAKRWTKEEDKLLSKLVEPHTGSKSQAFWREIATHFSDRTGEHCRDHWRKKLNKPVHKRKLEENNCADNRTSKIARRQLSASPHASLDLESLPAFQEIKKVEILIQNYALAVQHFNCITFPNLELVSYQQEAQTFLANASAIYSRLSEKLRDRQGAQDVWEEIKLEIGPYVTVCEQKIIIYETLYQHFMRYQTNQEDKMWFESFDQNFSAFYIDLICERTDKAGFEILIEMKESDYWRQKLIRQFNHFYNQLCHYAPSFSPDYQNCLHQLKADFEADCNGFGFNDASLKEKSWQIEQVYRCFYSFDRGHLVLLESIIIDYLNNRMDWQTFHLAQQGVITTIRELAGLRMSFLNLLKINPILNNLREEDVNKKFSFCELEAKFKKVFLISHPDKGGDTELSKKLNELRSQIREAAGKIPKDVKF